MIDENAAIADPNAAVLADEVSFTAVTPTLLRLEYAPDGCFEDRPSLFAVQRRPPAVPFERRRGRSGSSASASRSWLTPTVSSSSGVALWGEGRLLLALPTRRTQ